MYLWEMPIFVVEIVKPLPSDTEHFQQIKRLEYTVRSIEETKDWLANLEIAPQVKVIVSYDFQTALLLPWSIFTCYYDDLCYQGLEDICICPVDEHWYLLYCHKDVFLFGRQRRESQT